MDRKKLLLFIIQMTPYFLKKSNEAKSDKHYLSRLNNELKIITWKNVAKFIVCLCSFTGFFYQASEYFVQYLQYPTIVNVKLDRSYSIEIPSLSICIPSLTSRPLLMKMYGKEIESELKLFDKKNASYLAKEREIFQRYENISAQKLSPQNFFDLGIHAEDIIECSVLRPAYFKNDVWIPCDKVSKVLETIGPNGKCFTYFTKLNQIESEDVRKKFQIDIYQSVRDQIGLTMTIKLSFNSSNYIDMAKIGDESILLHETTAVPSEGKRRRLKPGTYYDVFFTRLLSINLPKPHSTDCRFYNIFNKDIPQSRVDCVDRCIKEIYYDFCKCYPMHVAVRHDIVINRDLRMCNDSNPKLSECRQKEVSSRCIDRCQLDCEETNYDFDTEEDVFPSDYEINESDGEERAKLMKIRNFTAMIKLWRKVSGDTIYEHKQELPLVQLFSFVGGLASLWLGISIIAFYDILVRIVTFIYKTKPFEKMRKRDTAVTVLSNWGTNATKTKHDFRSNFSSGSSFSTKSKSLSSMSSVNN